MMYELCTLKAVEYPIYPNHKIVAYPKKYLNIQESRSKYYQSEGVLF
jgi:hypothetical protein